MVEYLVRSLRPPYRRCYAATVAASGRGSTSQTEPVHVQARGLVPQFEIWSRNHETSEPAARSASRALPYKPEKSHGSQNVSPHSSASLSPKKRRRPSSRSMMNKRALPSNFSKVLMRRSIPIPSMLRGDRHRVETVAAHCADGIGECRGGEGTDQEHAAGCHDWDCGPESLMFDGVKGGEMHGLGDLISAVVFAAFGAYVVFAPDHADRLSRAFPVIRLRRNAITTALAWMMLIVGSIAIAVWLVVNL